jgi:hypothetical protein
MNDIFDEDISDLDTELLNILSLTAKKETRFQQDTLNCLSLFDVKQPLTLDQLILGMARKFNVYKSRGWMYNFTKRLIKKGILQKINKNSYIKTGE